jgi:alpha-glucosidase
MQNSSLPPFHPTASKLRRCLPICLLLATACTSSAQILARPGYKGASAKNDLWWKNAIFYNISTDPIDCQAIAVRLDALRALNVDALILPAPALPTPGSNGPMPNLDDFDSLLRQASAHGLRVLLTIHATGNAADLSGLARFWLNRGVAGLHIATAAGEDTQAAVQSIRKLASNVVGQRIIISDADLAPPDAAVKAHHASATRASLSQLQIDNRAVSFPTLDAASLRPLLTQAITQPSLIVALNAQSSSNARPPLAEPVAAIALIPQLAALIDSSASLALQPTEEQPKVAEEPAKPTPPAPPPQAPPGTYLPYTPYVPPAKPRPVVVPKLLPEDPLTTWYKQLSALHHDNGVLKTGTKIFLDFDAQNALVWVTKPAPNSPRLTAPVVVICNLSATPLQLSLADAMKKLALRGFYLRTLLRTDQAMGAQDLNTVNVPAFSVYIGELHL